jgi:hypothetical protein
MFASSKSMDVYLIYKVTELSPTGPKAYCIAGHLK